MHDRVVRLGLASESASNCTYPVGTLPLVVLEVVMRFAHEKYDPACADMCAFGFVFLDVLCDIGRTMLIFQWSRKLGSPFYYRKELK